MGRHRAEDMQNNHLEDIHMNPNQTPAQVETAKAPEPQTAQTAQTAQAVNPAETAETKSPEKTEHTMKRGDTLRSVAARYGTSPEYLVKINEIEDPNAIKVDQTIKLKV